tara:strand:- start:147 stop:518 length:372 start_codon:yes stop_codon:yes gene_type:complete
MTLSTIIQFVFDKNILTTLYFGVLGLLPSSRNSTTYLKTHLLESIFVVIATVFMLWLTFKEFMTESFTSGKCCLPKGLTPHDEPECNTSILKKCSDGTKDHLVGKLIKNGKYRCMGDGRAYKC